MRSVADCKAAAIWRANTLCERHGIIRPRITYNLRGTDAGQAFLQQNRIDLNLLLFRENCDLKSFFAAVRRNSFPAKNTAPTTLRQSGRLEAYIAESAKRKLSLAGRSKSIRSSYSSVLRLRPRILLHALTPDDWSIQSP